MTALEDRVRSVPELAALPKLRFRPLEGGLNNTSLLIEAGDEERFVLRLNADVLGVDRHREARILRELANSELSPDLIAVDPEQGYLLTRFVDEPAWPREHTEDRQWLEDLGRTLQRLHQHPVAPEPVDPAAWLTDYLGQPAIQALSGRERIESAIMQLVGELEESGFARQRTALCHMDLSHTNILGPVRPVLIDWEFAAVGNALLDLAIYIHYHDLDHDRAEPFLESYFGGPVGAARDELQLALRLAQALEWLWLQVRHTELPLPEPAAGRLRRLQLVWG